MKKTTSLRIPDEEEEATTSSSISSLTTDIPTSPTDTILSPCSSKLLRKNNFGSSSLSRRGSKMTYTLSIEQESPPTLRSIVLGSSSKNRQRIISSLGWPVSLIIPDIDEKAIRNDDPYSLPLDIAKAKANEVMRKVRNSDMKDKDLIIITADQIVYFNNEIREKPKDEHEAKQFLLSYSNSQVSTISAIVTTHYDPNRESGYNQKSFVNESKVYWCEISPSVVDKVVAKALVYSSAGGFRIEDEDLNPLIASIEGSVACIVGLNIVTLKVLS